MMQNNNKSLAENPSIDRLPINIQQAVGLIAAVMRRIKAKRLAKDVKPSLCIEESKGVLKP